MVAHGNGGRIVFTSSVHAQMCFPLMAVYGSTKQALRALTETMAIELGQHAITVNHIGPGWVKSALNDRSPGLREASDEVADPGPDPDLAALRADRAGPRRRVPLLAGGGLRLRRVPPRGRRLRRREVLTWPPSPSPASPAAIADAITARLDPPPLDTVVAGVDGLPTGAFLDIEQGDWEATVAGARAAFLFAQAEAARLVAAGQPGRIVFLVPTSSVRVVQGASLLSTAGAFLTTTAQVGAVELGPTGVTVNVVACGWPEGAAADLAAGVPVGRLGAARRRRRRRRLPRLRGGRVRQRRDARRRRRLLDHEDRRRLAPPALRPMRLSLTDNTFRLLAALGARARPGAPPGGAGRGRLHHGRPLAPAAGGHPRRHPAHAPSGSPPASRSARWRSPTCSASRGSTSSATHPTTRTRRSATARTRCSSTCSSSRSARARRA